MEPAIFFLDGMRFITGVDDTTFIGRGTGDFLPNMLRPLRDVIDRAPPGAKHFTGTSEDLTRDQERNELFGHIVEIIWLIAPLISTIWPNSSFLSWSRVKSSLVPVKCFAPGGARSITSRSGRSIFGRKSPVPRPMNVVSSTPVMNRMPSRKNIAGSILLWAIRTCQSSPP